MLRDETRTWRSPELARVQDGHHAIVVFQAEFWKPSPESEQPAHFSVTSEGWYGARKKLDVDFCGACGPETFMGLVDAPEKVRALRSLCKWHLCDVRRGPMHYAANAAYWWRYHLAQNKGTLPHGTHAWIDYYDPEHLYGRNPLDHFHGIVVYGAVPEEGYPSEVVKWSDHLDYHAQMEANVTAWCAARFPRLMEAFERDMVAFWGEEVRVP